MRARNRTRTWKGFDLTQLEPFGVELLPGGVQLPYLTRNGEIYRYKLFPLSGEKARWLGDTKPQIPYGLETVRTGGDALIFTEGESDSLALRLAFTDVAVLGIPGANAWRSEWAVYAEDFRRVYLSFDADRAGDGLATAVAQDFPHHRLILLPRGTDTRQLLQTLGKRAFRVLREAADARYEIRLAMAAAAPVIARAKDVEAEMQARAAS